MKDDTSETHNVSAFHSQCRIVKINFFFLSSLLSEKVYTYNNVLMSRY